MDKIIENVNNNFYGSIKDTYNDARKKDPSIKYDDVRRWFAKNQLRKTNLRCYNSFIADSAYEEFQIDLFVLPYDPTDEYKIALLTIDVFSKFIDVQPLNSKQPTDILQALQDAIHNMKGSPRTIYSDDEGSFNSHLVQNYFREHNIRHLVTRTHAAFAERGIKNSEIIDR